MRARYAVTRSTEVTEPDARAPRSSAIEASTTSKVLTGKPSCFSSSAAMPPSCQHRAPLRSPPRAGDAIQQRAGVGMLGIAQYNVGRTAFDDASAPHHDGVFGDLPDDGEVVGDEHVRDPRRVANVGQ